MKKIYQIYVGFGFPPDLHPATPHRKLIFFDPPIRLFESPSEIFLAFLLATSAPTPTGPTRPAPCALRRALYAMQTGRAFA